MFKELIFDCDGVLVDTEIVAAEVVMEILDKHGNHVSKDEYLKDYTGKIISEILLTIPEENRKDLNLKEIMENAEHTIYDRLRPVPGMPELIPSLPLRKSVVSNSALWQVKKAIKHINVEETFEQRYFSAQMVEKPKPHPDVYLLAAKTLSATPSDCLVVEDSKAGVTAAVAAGMTVIGFTAASHILDGHGEALKNIGAKYIASSADELNQIINQLVK